MNRHAQQGFNLVMAIFIVVILALLGSYMVRLSGVQHTTASYILQGARAYQAARAGLGWAVARIKTGGTCTEVNAQTALSLPGISNFTVRLTCTSESYTEGVQALQIFKLNARSEYGSYLTRDYVSRNLEVSIVK